MKSLILFMLFFNAAIQEPLPYDVAKVSEAKELKFYLSDKRGIKYMDIVYYVENDLNTVTAYSKNKVVWKSCLLGMNDHFIGKPEIRHISIDGKKLHITYAKHSYYEIDIKTGKVDYFGSD